MNKIIYFVFALVMLSSCSEETASTAGSEGSTQNPEELAQLKQENEKLKNELALKDSAINSSVNLITEIEQNLTEIASSQRRIRQANVENQEDPKQFILGEIEQINNMRKYNQQMVAKLQKQLEESGLQNTELRKLVESLTAEIAAKEMEIDMLQKELETLDGEYVELFEEYMVTAEIAEDRKNELNAAWYTYGTSKELKENGVITKEGGFIGMGKVEKLKQDFNQDYFERIDITQTKQITIHGKKPQIVTTHPAGSYGLVEDDNSAVLRIDDPKAFWSASKYLVILVN